MLYYMGSGQLPFFSDSIHELVAKHASDPAPRMPDVPSVLAAVIDKMLRKDPAHRFQTAALNREALEEAAHAMRVLGPIEKKDHFAAAQEDTRISIGPFPAQSGQFEFLKSVAPHPIARRGTNADNIKAAMSETFLGDEAVVSVHDAVSAVVDIPHDGSRAIQPAVAASVFAHRNSRIKNWVAGASLMAVTAIAGFALTRGGGGSGAPATPASSPAKAMQAAVSFDAAPVGVDAMPSTTVAPVAVSPPSQVPAPVSVPVPVPVVGSKPTKKRVAKMPSESSVPPAPANPPPSVTPF